MSYFETNTRTEFATWIVTIAASLGVFLPSSSFANDELDVFQQIDLPEVEIDFEISGPTPEEPVNTLPIRTTPAPTAQAPAPAPAPAAQVPMPVPNPARAQVPVPVPNPARAQAKTKNPIPPLPVRAPKRAPVPAQVINVPEQPLRDFVEAQTSQAGVSNSAQQKAVADSSINRGQTKTGVDPFTPLELPPIVIENSGETSSADAGENAGVSKPVRIKRPKKLKVTAPPVPEDEVKMPSIKENESRQAKKKSKLAPPAEDEFPSENVETEDPVEVAVPPKAVKKGQKTARSDNGSTSVVVPKPSGNKAPDITVELKPAKPDNAKKVTEKKPDIESGIGKTLAEFAEGKLNKAGSANASASEQKNEKEAETAKCVGNQEKPNALTSQAEEIIKALEQASCRGCSKLAMLREKLSALKLSDDPASKLEAQVLLEEAAQVLREMRRESSGKLTRLQVREAVAFMRVAEEKDLHRAFIEKAQDTLVASKDLVIEEIRRRPESNVEELTKPKKQTAPSRLEQFAQPRLKEAYKKIDEIEI